MFTSPRLQPASKASRQPQPRFQTGDLVRPRTHDATLCEVLGAEDAERIRVRGLGWLPGYSAIIPAKEIYLVSRVETDTLKGAG